MSAAITCSSHTRFLQSQSTQCADLGGRHDENALQWRLCDLEAYAPLLRGDLVRSAGLGSAWGEVGWAFLQTVPLILKERKTWGNRSWFSIRQSRPSHILPLPFPPLTKLPGKPAKKKAYVGRRRAAFNFCTSYSTQCHTMHRMRISQGTLHNTSTKAHTHAPEKGEQWAWQGSTSNCRYSCLENAHVKNT